MVRDTDIEGFWELELMIQTNTFNNPDRFEIERRPFLEKGLITEEQFHRTAFIAYLVNLNEEKTKEHYGYICQYPHLVNPVSHMPVMQMEEIHFLNWIGAVKPGFVPSSKNMTEKRAKELRKFYSLETWHRNINKPLENQFYIDKRIAVDAWGLYVLSETIGLDNFEKFDQIYVCHSTVIYLLKELSVTGNAKIRNILNLIRISDVFQIVSAGFKTQMEIRNNANYNESAAAAAVSVEKECLIVLGDPEPEFRFINKYKHSIIRVSQVRSLLESLVLV